MYQGLFCLSPYTQDVCSSYGHEGHGGQGEHGGLVGQDGLGGPKFCLTKILFDQNLVWPFFFNKQLF